MLNDYRQRDKGIGFYIDVGLQFAVAIALGVGLGYYLDLKWNTSPLMLVVGLLLGAASGFLNLYRAVYPSSRRDNEKKS